MTSTYVPIYQSTTDKISLCSIKREKRQKIILITTVLLACLTITGVAGFCVIYFGLKGDVQVSGQNYTNNRASTRFYVATSTEAIGSEQPTDRAIFDEPLSTPSDSSDGKSDIENLQSNIDEIGQNLSSEAKVLDELSQKVHQMLRGSVDETTQESFTPMFDIPDHFKKHKNFHKFDLKSCGKTDMKNRIQFGEKADILDFPWMVALFFKNQADGTDQFECGGSLIAENLVLTSAHCIPQNKTANGKKLYQVRLGDGNIDDDEDDDDDEVQNIYNFTTHIHPDYDGNTALNDIAIIKLGEKAKLERQNINTVCLPFMEKNLPKKVVVTGFGLRKGRIAPSDVLMRASMDVILAEDCDKHYTRRVTEDQFCASKKIRNPKNKKEFVTVDTCQGDSGGPAVYPEITTQLVQYGITSWGQNKECGADKSPGVYTKVHSYLEWILNEAD